MYWGKKPERPCGGTWRCRVKRIKRDAERWQRYEERMPPAVRIRKTLAARKAKRRASLAERRAIDPVNPKLVQALISVKKEADRRG